MALSVPVQIARISVRRHRRSDNLRSPKRLLNSTAYYTVVFVCLFIVSYAMVLVMELVGL